MVPSDPTPTTPPPAPGSSTGSRTRRLVVLLVVLGGFRVAFPGDVSFVNDEPLLIRGAFEANADGHLVQAGLAGTRGARYGPLPTWLYQAGLSVTTDLRWIAAARITLITVLSGLALTLLSRAIPGVIPSLGAFAFLSPYLWLYARDLWDNSFSIAWTAMVLGAYASFCRDGRLRWLSTAALFGTFAVLTHLMTLPLVAAVASHFAFTRWRRLLASPRFALGVAGTALVCLAVAGPYLLTASGSSPAGFRFLPAGGPVGFSLGGWRLFSLWGLDYFFGPWSGWGAAFPLLALSLLSYPVGAYGVYLCLRAADDPDAPLREMAGVLLLSLAFFVVLANGMRLREHPHYYNGMWIAFFAFWWIGMSALARHVWARRLYAAQAGVMATALLTGVLWIHVHRGTRSLRYGPTLANQIEIARALERLGPVELVPSTALGPRMFPHAIETLRLLERGTGAALDSVPRASGGVQIVYADPDGNGGEIVLVLSDSSSSTIDRGGATR